MRTLLILALVGCGGGDKEQNATPPVDTAAEVIDLGRYDPEHLTWVQGTLPADEWRDLTQESRLFWELLTDPQCFSEPEENIFLWHEGDVTVDGEFLTQVGFRKKGFIGSLSWTRPSIKIDSDRFVEGQRFEDDTEHFTLNNNNQDPSRLHSCLAYAVFRKAGVPASWCSYAAVEMNGASLGVFSNVEPIKNEFLRRNFGNDDGDLYEGAISDFTGDWLGTFQVKTEGSSRVPLQELADAIVLPDDQLITGLEGVIDLDGFITQWAAESLIGHWDGYASGSNNFYVYKSTDDGLLHFIPWGPDATFEDGESDGLYAYTALSMRLWNHPDGQARYLAESQRLLDDVWDETWLHSEIDRMEALIAPHLLDPTIGKASIDDVRVFVDSRRATVQAAIDERPGRLEYERPKICAQPIGEVSATFSTVWDSMSSLPFLYEATLEGTLNGEPLINNNVGTQAGVSDDGQLLLIIGADAFYQEATIVALVLPDGLEAGTYPIDIAAVTGVVFNTNLNDLDAEPSAYALMGGETIFGEFSYTPGEAISGELTAILIPNVFD